ncbi:hypothetical protein BASA81_003122 [Batrachochytrium salamandrivorans]|nr:hypothetical protein BASA81_003122 [Batrachochytrium salamandrivorans]
MKLAAVVVVGGGGTRGGDEEGGGVSKASPTNSVSSDLGAAASALFNMRSSPVVMSQKQIHSHNKNMPFLSLSPPVMAAPVSSSFQATRQRSQTWDASNSNLASPGFFTRTSGHGHDRGGDVVCTHAVRFPFDHLAQRQAPPASPFLDGQKAKKSKCCCCRVSSTGAANLKGSSS